MYSEKLGQVLANGGIAVIRTDTIYGLVGRANSEATVERIYQTKGRTPSKSPIVLIANTTQLLDTVTAEQQAAIAPFWPGPNSIIVPSPDGPTWLTRGNHSIAYRLPDNPALRALIATTGPLIAPSANPEGLPPATTIAEARHYFGENVDYYEDGGTVLTSTPSSLYRLTSSGFEQLR